MRNRREFIQTCAAGAAVLAGETFTPLAAATTRSKVVIARDTALRQGSKVDPARLAGMLDRAMQACFNRDNVLEAWRLVVSPADVVALKVNCLGGPTASTSVDLVDAICERLKQVGIPPEHIFIIDRGMGDEMQRVGFVTRNKIRCVSDVASGHGPVFSFGKVKSRVSKMITQYCSAVINLPILKDHSITGVTAALKSFYGSIDNPSSYHGNAGNPYIADVNMLEPIRQKVRLHICDALRPQFHGGPIGKPHLQWNYNGLLVSRDPVALDYVGWQILENQRKVAGFGTLSAEFREPKYLATAADANHRLGTNDPALIDRVEV
ncbi:MAG TPA: DUF362 domain-containing protein [Terriglobales bacterium]|nr:DUF362 domain-containing protein [Terriglobales bacterium]